MIIFKGVEGLHKYLNNQKQKGKTIGFVPTMGALHDGHLSLIRRSKEQAGITVCSIFVNPTQFNDPKDFEKYPITTSTDIALLSKQGAEVLFLPSVEEIYPEGVQTTHHYNLGYLETILEGAHRPGHFQGVCQVVNRLLDIIKPDMLFLGQKDYQQCMVLKKLVSLLAAPIEISIVETAREQSGLAMSSRNMRLSSEQKEQAASVYAALKFIQQNINAKSITQLQVEAGSILLSNGFEKIDYVALADADTLQPLTDIIPGKKTVALVAAFIGGVRLIDNMLMS